MDRLGMSRHVAVHAVDEPRVPLSSSESRSTSVAVKVLGRPTFEEPLPAMARTQSEHLTLRMPRAGTLGHIAFA